MTRDQTQYLGSSNEHSKRGVSAPRKSTVGSSTGVPILLDAEEVGLILNLSRATVYRLNAEGRLPRPVHLGRSTRWRREELVQWVQIGCPSRERWEFVQDDVCVQKIHKRNPS